MAVQRFGVINWVDKVDWPPQGDREAGVLSSSIRANWFTRTEHSFGALSSDAKISASEVQACAEWKILR